MGSDEDDFYHTSGDEDEQDQTFSQTESAENAIDEEPETLPTPHRGYENYTILKEKDIRKRQQNDISSISSVLNVSRQESCAMLYQYSWVVNTVHEEWFSDEKRVRQSVGILEKPLVISSKGVKKIDCKICYESCKLKRIASAVCGHPFCTNCWKSYISTSINSDGPGCLKLRCPEPECIAIAGLELIDLLASDEDKKRYYKYLLRSYVEDNKERKWCPSPACESAVEYDDVDGCENFEVTCDCSNKFCWNCLEDSHRPVACETVANWNRKNNDEAENTTWILAYTKPCPKCKRAIEKNHGCSHMTCGQPCGFEFCWLCLVAWEGHNHCNQFEINENTEKEMAKKQLVRYTHYYERWASNNRSWKIALADSNLVTTKKIEKLARVQEEPEAQLTFVTDAWEQIVECRRVLKWTYVYGYYILEDDHGKSSFFEYLQGEAEHALERLHHCAEMEMEDYLRANRPMESFRDFRRKLAGLTQVTRNYFENLVRALENNLCEVEDGKKAETGSSSKKACKRRRRS